VSTNTGPVDTKSNVVFHDIGPDLVNALVAAQRGIVCKVDDLENYEPATRIHLEHILKTLDTLRFGADTRYGDGLLLAGPTFLAAPKQTRSVEEIFDEFISEYFVCNGRQIIWSKALLYIKKYLIAIGAKSDVVEKVIESLPRSLDEPHPKALDFDIDACASPAQIRIYYGDSEATREWLFDSQTGQRI
jgi:hypothetical protein